MSVRGGGKGKGVGGMRRTAVCPCGHIVRGVRQRLGTELRLHKRVCQICKDHDLSAFVNKKEEHLNLTDLRGGTNYRTNHKSNTRGGGCQSGMESCAKTTLYNTETGQTELLDINSSSTNCIDNITGLGELMKILGEVVDEDEPDLTKIFGEEEVKKETKTQKKRRMRKNKKEREFNASIGLGEKTDAELNPFELDFKIKKYIE